MKRMALGWFVNFMPPAWRTPWAGTDVADWADGRFYVEVARALERARLDFVVLEDSSVVPQNHGGSARTEFMVTTKAPKNDPLPLAGAIAAATTHLGIVTTMSTSLYPPAHLARLQASLDVLSRGRAGWNVVTSFEEQAAQNVGLDTLWEHDQRYDRADEFVDLTQRLWRSTRDGTPVEHAGRFFTATGRFDAPRPPQGSPVLCQAGGSPRGLDFAARHAEVVVAVPQGVEAMARYRRDLRERRERAGLDPDACRVLFMVTPVVGETDAEARARHERMWAPTDWNLLRKLVFASNTAEIDFARFDLDEPVPADATTNGAQSLLEQLKVRTRGSSLRAAFAQDGLAESLPLVGTPETVADRMQEAMDVVGGDGFLFFHGGGGLLSRRYLTDVLDGIVPELQRRGLAQREYAPGTFRDKLATA
ncbi:FMN-dependent oxidoreductase (nitrilotriacetate monooxygenase family) [Kineococcus rhizosphaerae]|uniref:FMN-dependent oxidoreductase (Nitrilotriacetate monooxygenase family) n=2 Tax=Kineococcus rhizosphaerae TaxID=559628 RepID=A0A2T0QXX4_9ACTN|nr:FMN-dependent oxidoreductase (nitrilotriacetate monooxygenase family) [Kineococcus rhizosphaerae]